MMSSAVPATFNILKGKPKAQYRQLCLGFKTFES